jgi:hypothetical protein
LASTVPELVSLVACPPVRRSAVEPQEAFRIRTFKRNLRTCLALWLSQTAEFGENPDSATRSFLDSKTARNPHKEVVVCGARRRWHRSSQSPRCRFRRRRPSLTRTSDRATATRAHRTQGQGATHPARQQTGPSAARTNPRKRGHGCPRPPRGRPLVPVGVQSVARRKISAVRQPAKGNRSPSKPGAPSSG